MSIITRIHRYVFHPHIYNLNYLLRLSGSLIDYNHNSDIYTY